MNGYHIIAYDLTTAQDGGSEAFANPSVRVGNTICSLLISENIYCNIRLKYQIKYLYQINRRDCVYKIAYIRLPR
jgi:hypothetical protein